MTTSIKHKETTDTMTKNIKETHKPQILEETTIDTAATMTEKTGEPLIFLKTTKQDDSSSFRPFQKSEVNTFT